MSSGSHHDHSECFNSFAYFSSCRWWADRGCDGTEVKGAGVMEAGGNV